MSGVGPVEPGEGTRGLGRPPARPRPLPAWAARAARHRRALIAAAALTALAGGVGYLHAARPRPPAPVAAAPSAPSQVVSFAYGHPVDPAEPGSAFAFTLRVAASSGPPVTVERIGQPSRALAVASRPRPPLVVAAGEARDLVVEIRAVDCVHVARNSGLPFLEVTLSNQRQKEEHGYILGDRYARDLSDALTRACPEDRDAVTSGAS
ncbi:Tat pathway signal sequence domain protein [Streptomyces sp. NPDC127040]|uniref:Tat pathway signal sequence domain protein n=1 Tax=Streptomyces sp. NPDC127040 TaxID=3347116 RepID=UPI00366295B0